MPLQRSSQYLKKIAFIVTALTLIAYLTVLAGNTPSRPSDANVTDTARGSAESKGSVAERFRYLAPNCDFAVSFPGEPRKRVSSHPVLGLYEEAGIFRQSPSEPWLKSECIPVPDNLARLGGPQAAVEVLQHHLSEYAAAIGLANAAVNVELGGLGPTGTVQGTKLANGVPVIVQIRSVIGPDSNINVFASGPAESYPFPGATDFLTSIEKAQ